MSETTFTKTPICGFQSSKPKYLVTGGAGFIGSHLVHELIRRGHDLVILDDFSSGLKQNIQRGIFELRISDFSNWQVMRAHISDGHFENIDGVFHIGAEARIQPSIADPRRTFEVNALGTFNVLEMMRIVGIPNIVYSASSSTYGLTNKPPLREDMTPNPLNPYAVTKLMGELMCQTYGSCYGIQNISLKYFNVYGERSPVHIQNYSPVIGLFFKQALYDKTNLTVVGDGQQKRDFTHVNDVVNANIVAMEDLLRDGQNAPAEGCTVNIGSGANYTILEIAQKVQEALKDVRPDLKIEHIPARPGEARETLADNSFAKDSLGWQPKISLDEGIKLLTPYYINHFRRPY